MAAPQSRHSTDDSVRPPADVVSDRPPRPTRAQWNPQQVQQQRLELALHGGRIGLWEYDLGSGGIYWSDTLYDMLGRSRDEPIDRDTFFQYVHPEDRPRVRERARQWWDSGAGEFEDEFRVVREDGQERWLASRGRIYPGEDGGPGLSVGVNFDITDRKRAEEQQRRNEAIFRRLAEANLFGVGFGDTKGNVTYVNDEMLRMMGRTREEYDRGEIDWTESIVPEDRGKIAEWGEELMRKGEVVGYERVFRRPDGTRTPYLGAAALVEPGEDFHVSIALDLTDIQAAEEALRRANEDLERRVAERTEELQETVTRLQTEVTRRQLAEQELRTRSDKLQRMNVELDQAVAQLRREVAERLEAETAIQAQRDRLYNVLNLLPGYVAIKDRRHNIRFASHGFLETFGEPEGRPCHEVQYGSQEACEGCPLSEVLDAGRTKDWEYALPDGRSYHVWAYPFDDDGENMLLEFGIDITDRKRLELMISELSESERRSIGRDLHDTFGQTMTGLAYLIGGLADRICDELPDEQATAEHVVTTINQATAQVRAMAHGLDPVGLEADGLVAALRELAEGLEAMHGQPCEFRGPRKPPPLDEAAATHLYRIAQEALTNAARHAGASRVKLTLARDAEAVTLRVSDDGGGLPDDLSGSTGMGLRAMQYRASALGGVLRIRSRKDRGTTVTCIVPLLAPAAEEGEGP